MTRKRTMNWENSEAGKAWKKQYAKDWYQRNKQRILDKSETRVRFKDKRVFTMKQIRTGICSKCGKSVAKGEIERTVLHHIKYDPNDPLKHTVELCGFCHRVEHGGGKLSMTRMAINQRNYRARKRLVNRGV